jgi:hypothetical protein
MSARTPGPWHSETFRGLRTEVWAGPTHTDPYESYARTEARHVASASCNGMVTLATAEANARLIAAAPDLLAAAQLALQLIRDTWIEEHGSEQVGRAWGALHDAIEAATGGAS